MKITKIVLRKHKHLALRHIEELVFEPESKFQWILGTNGSGKSTLLREYSPMPAVPAHYFKGGAKIVECTDHDLRYRLSSDFSGPKNIFSFIEISPEGLETELNPGHTSSVFTNLVAQKFGIDKEVQEIRIGRRKFTEMSPVERKNWVSRISEADYTYALQYYQRLFTHYRDVQGDVKMSQQRLIEEKSKVMTPEEQQNKRYRLEVLKKEIGVLTDLRPNPQTPLEDIRRHVQEIRTSEERALMVMRRDLRNNRHLLPINDEEGMSSQLRLLQIDEARIQGQIQEHFRNSQKIQNEMQALGKASSLSDLEIHDQILRLKSLIHQVSETLQIVSPDHQEAKDLLLGFDQWNTALSTVLMEMTDDPELLLTEELREQLSAQYQQETSQLQHLLLQQAHLRTELSKQEECKDAKHVVCPNCQHHWNPGFSELIVKEIQEKLRLLAEQIDKLKASIQKLEEQRQTFQRHLAGLNAYGRLKEDYPAYQAFYSYVERDKNHRKHKDALSDQAWVFQRDLSVLEQVQTLKLELTQLEQSKALKTSESGQRLKLLSEQHQALLKRIDELYVEAAALTPQIQTLNNRLKFLKRVEEAIAQAKKSLEKLQSFESLTLEHEARMFIGDLILQRTVEMTGLEKSIREIDNHNHLVEKLQNLLQENKDYLEALKESVSVLSPREGLIAYGLTGFINHFINIVNSLIEKIWLYPMYLLPFSMEDENLDLDYKFKVQVNTEVVEDISFCSEGQKEIINLAIVITSLVMLHLDQDALLLDEFGSKMDPAHRASSYKAISELLTHSNFSHVLMVSHFDESFNAQLEADVSVICDANLHLPSTLVYNRHMKLT